MTHKELKALGFDQIGKGRTYSFLQNKGIILNITSGDTMKELLEKLYRASFNRGYDNGTKNGIQKGKDQKSAEIRDALGISDSMELLRA